MARYSINIVTYDRSAHGLPNYLPDTMRSLVRSGLFERSDFQLTLWDSGSERLPHIDEALAALPATQASPRRVRVEGHAGRLTVHENVERALVGAAADDPEYVLFLEDDLVVIRDFLGCVDVWLDRFFDRSPYRLATFYAAYDWVPRIFLATAGRLGWWRYPAQHFYGTQCMAMRPEVALGVAETAVRPGLTGYPDIRLKAYFEPDEHFLASVPCFVQHMGDESSIATVKHRTPGFPGEEWTISEADRVGLQSSPATPAG